MYSCHCSNIAAYCFPQGQNRRYTPYKIYILIAGHSPDLYIHTYCRTARNQPLNDIPKSKDTVHSVSFDFIVNQTRICYDYYMITKHPPVRDASNIQNQTAEERNRYVDCRSMERL